MLTFGLYCAIVGFVFSGILTKPGEILDFFPELVVWSTDNVKIHKLFFACEKCVSGQVALWFYMFYFTSYSILNHIIIISSSILFTAFLTKLWQKI